MIPLSLRGLRGSFRKLAAATLLTASVAGGFALLQHSLEVSPAEAQSVKPTQTTQYR